MLGQDHLNIYQDSSKIFCTFFNIHPVLLFDHTTDRRFISRNYHKLYCGKWRKISKSHQDPDLDPTISIIELVRDIFIYYNAGFQTNARPVAHGDCFSWVGALNLIVNSPVGEINLNCEKLLNYRSPPVIISKRATLCYSPTKYQYFRRVSKGR